MSGNPPRPERPVDLPFTNCIPELCMFYEDTCGCAQGHPLEGDQVIHWRGKHWNLECAFKVALAEIEKLQRFMRVPLVQSIRSGEALSQPAPADDERD